MNPKKYIIEFVMTLYDASDVFPDDVRLAPTSNGTVEFAGKIIFATSVASSNGTLLHWR